MTDILDVGVENEDVLDVQDRLRFLGYYHGHINGAFDSTTGDAVREFQHAAGVSATGTLDAHGLQHLREYSDHYRYGHGAQFADYGHHAHGHGHSSHDGHHETGHHGHGHGHDHGESGSVTFEEHVVKGDKHGHDHWVVQTISNVQEHALTMAALNDQAFIRAVGEYHTFIENQAEFQEQLDAFGAHVAMQGARSICDAVGIYLCGLAWPEIKWVAEQISMGISHSSSKIAYSYVSMNDANEIRAFFKNGMTDLARQVATLQEETHKQMKATFEPLLVSAKNNEQLPDVHMAWISRCYGSGGTDLDEAVEALFGIRGPARLYELEHDVYTKLVEDFYLAWYEASAKKPDSGGSIFPDRTPESQKEAERFANDPKRLARIAARDAAERFDARRGHPHKRD